MMYDLGSVTIPSVLITHYYITSMKTRAVHPMMGYCSENITDDVLSLNQHRVNISHILSASYSFIISDMTRVSRD